MEKSQMQSFNLAMTGFLKRLPKNYTQTVVPNDRRIALMLQEKAPPGQRWENDKRFREIGRITYAQARIIATTSQGPEEMQDRIRKLMLEGNDTTRYTAEKATATPSTFTEEQVQQIVTKALLAAAKQREGTLPEQPPEQTAAEAITPVEHNEQPKGLQHKPRKSIKDYQKAKKARFKFYADRAAILGQGPPRVLKHTGHITPGWMRQHERDWQAHLDKQPAQA